MTIAAQKHYSSLGVIILGAGASARMGRSKMLLPWGKTSITGHLIGQWSALEATQITVVFRSGDQELSTELDRLQFPLHNRIENPQPDDGMFSSVLCAARWNGWKRELTTWAIVLGDQPHLRRNTLCTLLMFQHKHADAICQPIYDGHTRHPVLLPRRAFEELRESREKTLRDFLRRTACPMVKCSIEDPRLGLDLDRPEDYEKALELYSGSV